MEVPYVDMVAQHAPIERELLKAIEGVLHHGQFILGTEVSDFEAQFAAYCGTRHAVGVDSGTSALFLVMKALGIGPGDEVITAPNSFLASASTIALTGARPVFADVGEDFNIDPDSVVKAITGKTKALMPVHLTGRPAQMDAIMGIAATHKLYVIEDCAQAAGARHRGQRVGGFGVAGCFSLHPLKTLNALGDGGVITVNDHALYETLIKARNHGLKNRDECEFWSHNCRLDTIQAAILNVKLQYLDQWNEARRSIAKAYQEGLGDVVRVPEDRSYEYAVYHTFVIQTEGRDELQEHLTRRKIGCRIHYPIPIHLQEAAKGLGYGVGSFPVVEHQCKRILSLPIYTGLTREQVNSVVETVRGFFRRKDG